MMENQQGNQHSAILASIFTNTNNKFLCGPVSVAVSKRFLIQQNIGEVEM